MESFFCGARKIVRNKGTNNNYLFHCNEVTFQNLEQIIYLDDSKLEKVIYWQLNMKFFQQYFKFFNEVNVFIVESFP